MTRTSSHKNEQKNSWKKTIIDDNMNEISSTEGLVSLRYTERDRKRVENGTNERNAKKRKTF